MERLNAEARRRGARAFTLIFATTGWSQKGSQWGEWRKECWGDETHCDHRAGGSGEKRHVVERINLRGRSLS
jgi:hypothetical protein